MSVEQILLRYHEIALKGENRGWFEGKLAQNAKTLVQRELGEGQPVQVTRHHGRMILEAEWNLSTREALGRCFGLSNFSPMRRVPTSLDAFIQAAREEFEKYRAAHGKPASFRILTRRTEKALPQTSTEIDRLVGAGVFDAFPGLKVDLENPELMIGIEVRHEASFLWTEKYPGGGGLPVGSNASTLGLLSGGLDSPVAAIQILKRGSAVSFIHFYGAPFIGEEALMKVEDLARLVNRYQPVPKPLHVVPFGKIQEKIALATNPKTRTVLYRRMMVRIACQLARKIHAQALVTGEALGQVASQTVENLSTINAVATLPILRPLIGMDKDEIIQKAKHYGTYQASIQPAADCCTLFADRHPSLRTTLAMAEEEEAKFPVSEFVAEAIAGTEAKKI